MIKRDFADVIVEKDVQDAVWIKVEVAYTKASSMHTMRLRLIHRKLKKESSVAYQYARQFSEGRRVSVRGASAAVDRTCRA